MNLIKMIFDDQRMANYMLKIADTFVLSANVARRFKEYKIFHCIDPEIGNSATHSWGTGIPRFILHQYIHFAK